MTHNPQRFAEQTMFSRLVRKELTNYLLDLRFTIVFALCALLSALSVYIGGQHYVLQLSEYSETMEGHRQTLQAYIDNKSLSYLQVVGERWNRRPEVLSPVVYGLSGKLGREVLIQYQTLPKFEASLFEEDPIYTIFGVLDLAFVVKIVLSICVLLFTYDAICGEKEGGTLRLFSSFPVARSTLALAKLVGANVAVLVPFLFGLLLAAVVMALVPEIDMQNEDWARMGALMVVFALYLGVFVAFGLLVSALAHRRMTAFLGLLGLWAVWVFIVPDLAVNTARYLRPAGSGVNLLKGVDKLLWEIDEKRDEAVGAYWEKARIEDWDALPDARKIAFREGVKRIHNRWDAEFYPRLIRLREKPRNLMRQQQRLAMFMSAVSPFGAVTFVSMDLARTGYVQKEWIEDALGHHLIYMGQYIRNKRAVPWRKERDLTDYSRFTYQNKETLGECLVRNAFHILNLVLLMLVGFAGAYVAILRYDVR